MRKRIIEIKDLKETGEVEAVIATLNVIDRDGDVTLPGFFGKQETPLVWHHDWPDWLGRGTVTEEGEEAIFRGSFFMGIPSVEEQHAKVKAMGNLADWSYGFGTFRGGRTQGVFEDQDVSFLQPLEDGSSGAEIYEVSPVLVGAGVGTHTRSIKSLDGPGGALKFLDQIVDTVEGVEAVKLRADEIIELRKTGTLGAESLDLLTELAQEVKELSEALALMVEPAPDADDALRAFTRFVSLEAAAIL